MRKCGQLLYSRTCHRWRNDMAHALCMVGT